LKGDRFPRQQGTPQIDNRFSRDLFRLVQVIRRVLAVVLVALWVPATLHCSFEAAGFENWFDCHEDVASSTGHCTDDVCQPLESFAYKSDAAAVKIHPPSPDRSLEWLILLEPSFAILTDDVISWRSEPPPLSRPWQFVHRAAPPVRAPGTEV
jgi:hypothetical protein